MSSSYRNSGNRRSGYDDRDYSGTRGGHGSSDYNRTGKKRRSAGRRRKRSGGSSFLDVVSDLLYSIMMALPWNRRRSAKKTAQARQRAAAKPTVSGEKEITIMRFSNQQIQPNRASSAAKRRRRKKKKLMRKIQAYTMRLFCVLLLGLIVFGIVKLVNRPEEVPQETEPQIEKRILPDYVKDAYLGINPNSRPGTDLLACRGIVIHQTDEVVAAEELRRQWDQRSTDSSGHSASHFIVDTNGSILCCIPIDEISYASDSRSVDTISITICRSSDEDPMSEIVRDSLEKLIRWICSYENLSIDQVMRHYDVSGRCCPEFFVNEDKQWEAFISGLKGDPIEIEPVVETEPETERIAEETSSDLSEGEGDGDLSEPVELGLEGEDFGEMDENDFEEEVE